ncbi:hypothetical protein I317_06984 [Kwoniella heveanensis CBS 569]|uniref:CWH43-like N-terminal domain-containing protein n=1 Tax=Kwoniella heveanensis BCC8398 TaxID=1296120 RepID=A0A1B9GR86_9TREE|nr:hypothetical protein I316_04794 [Kwoniella heveanensis BCC8398]OCF39215.1 hypothetical protein I317_06984 [Kwoniella heveanensis CBS 569]
MSAPSHSILFDKTDPAYTHHRHPFQRHPSDSNLPTTHPGTTPEPHFGERSRPSSQARASVQIPELSYPRKHQRLSQLSILIPSATVDFSANPDSSRHSRSFGLAHPASEQGGNGPEGVEYVEPGRTTATGPVAVVRGSGYKDEVWEIAIPPLDRNAPSPIPTVWEKISHKAYQHEVNNVSDRTFVEPFPQQIRRDKQEIKGVPYGLAGEALAGPQIETKQQDNAGRRTAKKKLPWWLNTRTFTSHCLFGWYIYPPLLASLIWIAGLTLLLSLWISSGKPRYKSDSAGIAFISDVGAAHQTTFIIICCTVIVLYFSTVCIIRWLRHKGRIPETVGIKEKIFSWLAIFWCAVGCAGLLVLARWNCWDYKQVHWYGTFVFITGVALSAIFQTAEVWCLRKEHENRQHLRRNSYIKLAIVALSVILAGTFGGMYMWCHGTTTPTSEGRTFEQCNTSSSTAAILEWTIAFGLNGYFLTLVADIWPSAKSSQRWKVAVKRYEEKRWRNSQDRQVGKSFVDMS